MPRAKADSLETAEEVKTTESKTVNEYMNEKVPFRAFKDGERYSGDIQVIINGEVTQIQRGKSVNIPRFVEKAIMDSERQKIKATMTSQTAEEKLQNAVSSNFM